LDGVGAGGEEGKRGKDLGGVAGVLLGHDAGDGDEVFLREEVDGSIGVNGFGEGEADFGWGLAEPGSRGGF
jgi:hypothetical protein